jgi:hypothetical protein
VPFFEENSSRRFISSLLSLDRLRYSPKSSRGNLKYPRRKRKFSTEESNKTSEESNKTSEESNDKSEEFAHFFGRKSKISSEEFGISSGEHKTSQLLMMRQA